MEALDQYNDQLVSANIDNAMTITEEQYTIATNGGLLNVNDVEDSKADDNGVDDKALSSNEDGEQEADPALNSITDPTAPPSVATPAVPALLVPSLRGKLVVEGTQHICRGVWAMSDDQHNVPGQTSEFEFRLVKSYTTLADTFPLNGKYQGWFSLKQLPPLKPVAKIEDKEMSMTFVKSESGEGYAVEGSGLNKFGAFSLNGRLADDGSIQLYRVYSLKPSRKSLSGPATPHDKGTEKTPKRAPLAPPSLSAVKVENVAPITPSGSLGSSTPGGREGGGRIRKSKSFDDGELAVPPLKMARAASVPAPVAVAPTVAPVAASSSAASVKPFGSVKVAASAPKPAPAAPTVAAAAASVSNRVQRVPLPLQKCGELLKELVKQPHAIWFSEPVDPIKLNIPDYPTIIKEPMDFRTIRINLENNFYASPDAFADHVRLVFRNATTYNVLRENPVNIAAREMSSRFEERYRQLTVQLNQNAVLAGSLTALAEDPLPKKGASAKGPRLSTGAIPTSRAPAATLKRQSSTGSVGPRRPQSSLQPLDPLALAHMPLPLDPQAHLYADMQREMIKMQNTINDLLKNVKASQTVDKIASAAHNPLSLEEKTALIDDINNFSEMQHAQVLRIIRENAEAHMSYDDDEIPINDLNTYTLRLLQNYVRDEKAKRVAPSAVVSVKRPKQERVPASPRTVKPPSAQGRGVKSSSSSQQLQPQFAAVSYDSSASTAATFKSEPLPLATADDGAASSAAYGHAEAPLVEYPTEEELIDSGDLLFGADSFDALRSRKVDYGSNGGLGIGDEEDDDDE